MCFLRFIRVMISLKNSILINGKVGDLVYYQLNGKEVSRRIGKISLSRYENDRSFSKMRANMSEFGAASMIGKVLRSGFTSYLKKCGDPYVSGRLNAVISKVISVGNGIRGKRSFELRSNCLFFIFDEIREF